MNRQTPEIAASVQEPFGVGDFGPGTYVLPDGTKFTIQINLLAQDAVSKDAVKARACKRQKIANSCAEADASRAEVIA